MEAHDAEPDRALAQRRIARTLHALGRARDEMGEHIVEEAQHVLDEAWRLVPLVPRLDVQRRQAAHGRALLVAMVLAGGERDLAAKVRGRDLEPELPLMSRHG